MKIAPGVVSGKSKMMSLQISNFANHAKTIDSSMILGDLVPFQEAKYPENIHQLYVAYNWP